MRSFPSWSMRIGRTEEPSFDHVTLRTVPFPVGQAIITRFVIDVSMRWLFCLGALKVNNFPYMSNCLDDIIEQYMDDIKDNHDG